METKIYNNVSGRYVQIDGQQYKKLLKEGYYINNNQLTTDISTKSSKISSPKSVKSTSKSVKSSKKSTKKTTKEWVKKSDVKIPVTPLLLPSPLKSMYQKDVFINVVKDLTPNDILSLYISNKDVVFDQTVLDYLSHRFKIDKVKSLKEFIQLYNLSIVDPYLYQLEYKIPMPTTYYMNNLTEVTAKMRAIVYDWLLQVNERFKAPIYAMGLAMSLLDAVFMKKDVLKKDLQGYGCMCHYIACCVFADDTHDIDMYDYVYIVDGAYDRKQMEVFRKDIIDTLQGQLIRPSIVFFADMKNEDVKNFVMLSYVFDELVKYKPSLVAEAIHYIVTGDYKIYSLGEISMVCRPLIRLLNRMKKSSLTGVRKYSDLLSKYDNYQCSGETVTIKQSPFKYNNEWHIGEYEKVRKIGEGNYGEVTHIKRKECNTDYVVKSSDSFNAAILELACLKLFNSNNIIQVCGSEIKKDKVKLYLPLMHKDLKKMVESDTFDMDSFSLSAKDMITGLHDIHKTDMIHRDIKPENIGYDALSNTFKILDFGISLPFASKQRYVLPDMASTYMYRAPEALFYLQYNNKIDIWALGCVFYYIFTKKYVVPPQTAGNTAVALSEIFKLFGTPTEEEWPGITLLLKEVNYTYPIYTKDKNLKKIFGKYYNFIMACFTLNPANRPSAKDLLEML